MTSSSVVYAATDIGSNATKTAIWRIGDDRTPRMVFQKRFPLRLAGAFRADRIEQARIDGLVEVFSQIAGVLAQHGVTKHDAVATDAFRSASNGDAVIEAIHRATGIKPAVLAPKQEGWLVARGVMLDGHNDRREMVIIDIGGGSAEVVLHDSAKDIHALSLPLGAVRLRERFIRSNPIAPKEYAAMREHVEKTIGKRISRVTGRWAEAIGCGGGVRFLHMMYGVFRSTIMQDQPLRCDQLGHLCDTIWPQRTDSLVKKYGIDPERAEIIVPGGVVLVALMKRLGLNAIRPSLRGIRDGLLAEFLESLK